LAEVLKPTNIQILILPSTMLNIHNQVERICYFEILTVYVKINSFVTVIGMTSNAMTSNAMPMTSNAMTSNAMAT